MFRVITLATSKGGVGKSSLGRSLAAHWFSVGHKPALIDADPQANLSQSFGIEEEPPFNLYSELKKEILQEGGQLSKAIVPTATGIDVVPASIDLAIVELEMAGIMGREYLISDLLKPLVDMYDYIFIDCPHAISLLTVNALVASDYVMLPLPGEFLPLKGVYGFMRQFDVIRKKRDELPVAPHAALIEGRVRHAALAPQLFQLSGRRRRIGIHRFEQSAALRAVIDDLCNAPAGAAAFLKTGKLGWHEALL